MSSYRVAALTVAAVAGCLAATGCGGLEVSIGSRSIADDASVNGPLSAVQLTSNSGDVTIRAGSGTGAAIHRTIHYRGKTKPRPSQQVTNGVLTFVKGCSHCDIDYELTVPGSVRVRIRSDSGAIRAADIASADLQTGSGDVDVHNIDGPVRAHTGSGAVRASTIGSMTDLHASSGDITATSVSGGTLLAKTGSGSIRLTFDAAPSNVHAVTGSGDLLIKLPGGPYRVEHSTGSGDDHVNVPNDPTATATIYARTGSGDLSVNPDN
jgi:hypothetical protein